MNNTHKDIFNRRIIKLNVVLVLYENKRNQISKYFSVNAYSFCQTLKLKNSNNETYRANELTI